MDSTDTLVEVDSTDAEIVARVAAIDVAKDSGMVCARVPHQTQLGRRTTVWSVSARTNSIIALADQLAEQDIERVVLDEATSDYWRPFYYLARSPRADGVAGQRPRCEERPWPAQDGQARCGAAPLVRPAGRDPPVARLHPAAGRSDRRTIPPYPATGEATRRRADQTVVGGHRHDGGLRPGDDRGTYRRRA